MTTLSQTDRQTDIEEYPYKYTIKLLEKGNQKLSNNPYEQRGSCNNEPWDSPCLGFRYSRVQLIYESGALYFPIVNIYL